MAKPRVGVLLRETVAGSKSSNQSADLENLRAKYGAFCQRLRRTIVALERHHRAMAELEASRGGVAAGFAALAKDTPCFDCIGLMPSADRPSNTVCSYMSTIDILSAKSKSYLQKYQQFVLEYAIEWEKVVTARINNGLKKAEELRRELDHYQKKTEALRIAVNQAMAKGRKVSSDQQEKLRRNEEKLINSRQGYNRVATDLCILMDEVTQRSWRDLHPLLIKVAQFDMTLSNDESKVLASLNQVVNELKNIATANGISPQPRLKDLATLKPELLSTRPGGVGGLAIEADPSATPANGAIFGVSLSPSASTNNFGGTGMGGFPIAVASPSGSSTAMVEAPYSSSSPRSFDPLASLATTLTPAVPPTLEDVYSATSRSAPSSGNMPPPAYGGPVPARAHSFNLDRSYGSEDNGSVVSGYSNYSAPSMPPPLPPTAPPVLPPGGYGGSPPPYGLPLAPASYGAPPVAQSPSGEYVAVVPPSGSWGSPYQPTVGVAPAPASYGAPPLAQSSSGGSGAHLSASGSWGNPYQANRPTGANPFG